MIVKRPPLPRTRGQRQPVLVEYMSGMRHHEKDKRRGTPRNWGYPMKTCKSVCPSYKALKSSDVSDLTRN